MAVYDLAKSKLVLAYDANGKWSSRSQTILHFEKNGADSLLYEFDLGTPTNEFKVIYYGTNMVFYQGNDVIPAKAIMKRLEGTDIEARFRAKEISLSPHTSPTRLLDALLEIGILPIRRKISPEYARDHLSYVVAEDVDPKRDRHILHNIGMVRKDRVRFVTNERNSGGGTEYMWFLVAESHEDALLALCLLRYIDDYVMIDYVASLFRGACQRMSRLVADKLILRNKRRVYIHSISAASHMCYLKAFLGVFKYAVVTGYDEENSSSLIDASTIDMWWSVVTDEDNENKLDVDTHLYMNFIRDDSTMLDISNTNALNEVFGYHHATIEVYVQPTKTIEQVADKFMAPSQYSPRRVLFISRDEYSDKYPQKRQKLQETEDELDDDE
jgi:hypothetical protein